MFEFMVALIFIAASGIYLNFFHDYVSTKFGQWRQARPEPRPTSAPAPATPQQSWPQPLWTEAEEREAIAEVNAAVAEFLEDCKRRNRTGRVDLMNRKWHFKVHGMDKIYDADYYGLLGQGWVFDLHGSSFGFGVTNDGDWCYISRYTYKRICGGNLTQEIEVCRWRAHKYGFEPIDPLDLNGYYGKGDEGCCTPSNVMRDAKWVIEQWRTSRPSRADRFDNPPW